LTISLSDVKNTLLHSHHSKDNPMQVIILVLSLFISFQAHAKTYSLSEALAEYTKRGLVQPQPQDDGRIQTLNRKGATSPALDEATTEFIKFAKGKKVLEIGGAYGQVMIETLGKYKDTAYHLNDLHADHLFIAAHNLEEAHLGIKAKNIEFIEGDIANGLGLKGKYDAILVARVLHFFDPEQLDAAIGNIKELLKSGGRVFVIAITPYVKRYDKFIPEYERRLAKNEEYPGYVKSLYDWVNKDVTSKSQLATISPEPFMFLDDVVLHQLFKKHGYKIISCKLLPLGYKSASWSLDGRENVVLVAEKE